MTPGAVAIVVVANTHLASLRVQDIGAMAFGVHPCVDDLFRRDAAPCGILASSGIRHAVLAENSVPLGTIGTNVRIDGCDLFGALLSSCGELCIAHDQGLQAVLCTLGIDQIQNFLTVVAGVRVFGVREDQHPVVAVGTALIVADTHGGGIRIQDALTGEIEVHPLVHGGVRSGHAGQIVLANGHIADAVLGKNGEVALTVGTHIRIRGSQLFGTLSSGGVVGGIAQLHAVQTGLCTGLVDELQEILLVHLIRTRSFDHAWRISIITGGVAYVFIMLVGSFGMNLNATVAMVPLLICTIAAVLLALVLEFFAFGGDYSRAERLEYEDDEYFYYVKAVPKASVATSERSIKKINAEPVREERKAEDNSGTYANPIFRQDEKPKRKKASPAADRKPRQAEKPAAKDIDFEKKLEESLKDL